MGHYFLNQIKVPNVGSKGASWIKNNNKKITGTNSMWGILHRCWDLKNG